MSQEGDIVLVMPIFFLLFFVFCSYADFFLFSVLSRFCSDVGSDTLNDRRP